MPKKLTTLAAEAIDEANIRDELDPVPSKDNWEADVPGNGAVPTLEKDDKEQKDPFEGQKIISSNKELYEAIDKKLAEMGLPEMPEDSSSPEFEKFSDAYFKILDELIPQRQMGMYKDAEAVAKGEKKFEEIPPALMAFWMTHKS